MSKKVIKEEIKKRFNTLVILVDKVFRLVGFAEDDDDYYYIFKDINGKFSYSSCSFGYFCLELDEEYEALNSLFLLNGCSEEKTFIKKKLK